MKRIGLVILLGSCVVISQVFAATSAPQFPWHSKHFRATAVAKTWRSPPVPGENTETFVYVNGQRVGGRVLQDGCAVLFSKHGTLVFQQSCLGRPFLIHYAGRAFLLRWRGHH